MGYDGVGIVEAVGPDVSHFNVGDEVYYSGSPKYQGSNQVLQLVDERLVAKTKEYIKCGSGKLAFNRTYSI